MNLQANLKKYFNYDAFQEGQEEIIRDVLHGEDVLGILKTGSGKSLCYQLPALMLPGVTIVVSPLISLMIDQVREIKAFHMKQVTAIHSLQSWSERKKVMQHLGDYKLIFVSPELLQQSETLSQLKKISISLFVIDEAHCISQWGYDFRPDYLRLSNIIQQLGNPPILALTGTATPEIQQDIIEHLKRPKMKKHIYSMDRYNISLLVHKLSDEDEKKRILLKLLGTVQQPTIIYFSSRKSAEQISHFVRMNIPEREVAFYHGGMDTSDRIKIQQQFLNDQLDIICSTSAFGMGINKRNIRFIIHYHMPTQLESYIQEIGRAGRDGKDSVSVLLYKEGDELLPLLIVEKEVPNPEEISFVFNQLYRLYTEQKQIPSTDEQIETYFQIEETKWRLLYYQLERYQVVIGNQIFFDRTKWQLAHREIIQFCQNRLRVKKANIEELKNWIHSTNCLRMDLYKRFHQSIHKRELQCCSNCGFSYKTWLDDVQTNNKQVVKQSWKEKLAILLRIGEINETSGNH